MTLENEIGTFLSALARVYRAPANTVAAYRGDLADFRRFLGDVAVEIIITADQNPQVRGADPPP